jgi:hypothetical protein
MLNETLPEGLMQALLLPLINELLPVVGDDQDAAWEAAEAATMSFNPHTVNEFRLAVGVALYNILGNRLTAEASKPGLTPSCTIRMHRCALYYIREADKAERRLEKLQAARTQEAEAEAEAETTRPETAATATEAPTAIEAPPAEAPTAAVPNAKPRQSTAADIPAYKRLKQERRLARQRERDERLKVLAEAHGSQDQKLPLAA